MGVGKQNYYVQILLPIRRRLFMNRIDLNDFVWKLLIYRKHFYLRHIWQDWVSDN
jgi:hypothetical protein